MFLARDVFFRANRRAITVMFVRPSGRGCYGCCVTGAGSYGGSQLVEVENCYVLDHIWYSTWARTNLNVVMCSSVRPSVCLCVCLSVCDRRAL